VSEDLDDLARKSIEEGASARTARPAPTVLADASSDETPSNVVRLPGATIRTRPERLTGTEEDAFRRIAETLGARKADDAAAAAQRNERASTQAPKPRDIAAAPAAATSEIETKLLDRLPVGLVVFRDHKVLFANRALLEMTGYPSVVAFSDAGGPEALFPGWEGGVAESGGLLKARKRDGDTVAVEARLNAVTWDNATALMLSISPRRERDGEDEETLVAELARAEARSEELAAILDTATDGVIVMDRAGKIGAINRAGEALFGIDAAEYVGRPFTALLAEESHRAALDYLDGLASNGVASVLNDGREVIGRVPRGGLIPLFMTMGRIGDSEKFCAVLRDITHWKNVEEALVAARRAAESANAQKSDFLAKISHEIRTPLNAIIGFSEVMMEERFGPIGNERYRTYLSDIHVSGQHLMSLINDLLDISKIEAGKLDLAFEAVAVNSVIQECVALMQPQANRERIIIRTSLSADVPNVVADRRSLRQILLNLLSNAVKFTKAGGQVIVSSALEENGEVVLRIRDTGVGMSEKDIETALKPFRQLATAKNGEQRGTGLGLPLTKALVEANRASFAIDSAVNQGTLVRITFPTTRVLAG
jgi:PAS domain S-box-containing protein